MDEFPQWFLAVIVVWNVSSAVADIIITLCMMALLLHAKSSTYFGGTRDMLSRLIRVILQTGLLTSTLALLSMAFVLGSLDSVYAIPTYILGKSYVISLLANLNARRRSDAPIVHGSDNNQAFPATKPSTVVFAPGNQHTGEVVNTRVDQKRRYR